VRHHGIVYEWIADRVLDHENVVGRDGGGVQTGSEIDTTGPTCRRDPAVRDARLASNRYRQAILHLDVWGVPVCGGIASAEQGSHAGSGCVGSIIFRHRRHEFAATASRGPHGAPYTPRMAVFARRLADGRRRFARVHLGVSVEFSAQADDFLFSMDGVGKDISLGGMFIETDIPCLFGEAIVVHLTLPRSRRKMGLRATVRWNSASGMGVQFGLLGAVHTHEIAEFTRTRVSALP
jgi:hypothetical protein